MMGYIRSGFRRSRTIDGEYCKYSRRSQYLWPRTGVVGIPSDTSSYLFVIIVFVAIQNNLQYWVIFEVDLEGQGRSMASTASIPIGASTSGHVLV